MTEKDANTNNKSDLEYEIDVEQLLLHSRNVFLHGDVNAEVSRFLCKDLLALDSINHDPIGLWVNSTGGSIGCGFSIIDTIAGLGSPVYTFICGYACSMGALIALAGKKRVMTEHSIWMLHDISADFKDWEYSDKFIARAEDYYKVMQERIFQYVKERTKLANADIKKARTKELWLFPEECKRKSVVDAVVGARVSKR